MIRSPREDTEHIHFPSVHLRDRDGRGFDYEEDLYVGTTGDDPRVERVIRFAIVEAGQPTLIRETFDELCEEELAEIEEMLPVLMDEENPAAGAIMRESAQNEFERQLRIAAGEERVCANCGCSETRACSGGCGWANETLCSNCSDAAVDAPLIEVVSDAEATRFLRARRAGAC